MNKPLMSIFKMPVVATITGRKSTITNAFINGIVPCIAPSEEEIEKALEILGLEADNLVCAYCGSRSTEWDHFRPLVTDKKPTGYISEIVNLVPACGKCNQSKGSQHWKKWMLSSAPQSPKTRNVPNLDEKVNRLQNFEEWKQSYRFAFEAVVGPELWRQHWENYEHLLSEMQECEATAEIIRVTIKRHLAT